MEVTAEAVREEMGRIKRRHAAPRQSRPPRQQEPPPELPPEDDGFDPPEEPFEDEEADLPLVDLAEDDEEPLPAEVPITPPPAEGPVMDTPGAAAFREAIVAYLAPVTWMQGQMLVLQQRGLTGVPAGAWERLLTAQRHAVNLYNELGISLALARPR